MTTFKHHLKESYKGIQVDVYHSMEGHWFGCVPNRVHYEYKTGKLKNKNEVIAACKKYIDSK